MNMKQKEQKKKNIIFKNITFSDSYKIKRMHQNQHL